MINIILGGQGVTMHIRGGDSTVCPNNTPRSTVINFVSFLLLSPVLSLLPLLTLLIECSLKHYFINFDLVVRYAIPQQIHQYSASSMRIQPAPTTSMLVLSLRAPPLKVLRFKPAQCIIYSLLVYFRVF